MTLAIGGVLSQTEISCKFKIKITFAGYFSTILVVSIKFTTDKSVLGEKVNSHLS